MSRVAIYCRLSEEDRHKLSPSDDSASIQNQKAMLTRHCLEQGWDIYAVYSDDDYTGSDRARPAFQQLLRDAQAGRFDIVLCKSQSRFTRELELVETYIHGLFPRWGIRFIGLADHADTQNPGNKKSRQINGLVNEWYLEDLSANIRSALTSRRQQGLHIGAFPLYGYRKDPDNKGRLLIDPEAAATVREVFSLYARGMGKTAIARALNQRGVPSPAVYRALRLGTPPPSGVLWSYAAIAHMLKNEMYTGTMVQGRYGSVSYKSKENRPRPRESWFRVEGTHAPIISPDLWDTVQDRLTQRAKPFVTGEIGLFAQKVRCAGCGHTLRSSKSRGRHYLQCPTRHLAPDACPGAFVAVDRLEELVLAQLRGFLDRYVDWDALALRLPSPQPRREELERRAAALERDAAGYSAALEALYLDRTRGVLSPADADALLQRLTARRDGQRSQAAALRRELAALPPPTAPQALLDPWKAPRKLTREIVDALIDHIVVGRRTPGTRQFPLKIHWRF